MSVNVKVIIVTQHVRDVHREAKSGQIRGVKRGGANQLRDLISGQPLGVSCLQDS